MHKEHNARLLAELHTTHDAKRREEIRQELITTNQPLVTVKVEAHTKEFHNDCYLWDDLIAEGTVALVKAVDQICSGAKINHTVGAYLGKAIKRAIKKYSACAKAIHEPPGSRHYNRAGLSDDELEQVQATAQSYTDFLKQREEAANRPSKRIRIPNVQPVNLDNDDSDFGDAEIEDPRSEDDTRLVDLRDEIISVCKSDEEITICEMREAGFSSKEIAAALNIKPARVDYLRADIHERLVDAKILSDPGPRRSKRPSIIPIRRADLATAETRRAS